MYFIFQSKSRQIPYTYTYILISQCTNKEDDTFEDVTNKCGYYLVDTRDNSVYGIDLNTKNSNNILFNVKKTNEKNEYEIVENKNKILNFEVRDLVKKINSGKIYKDKMITIFNNYI